jgi:hypothetical protein
MSATIAAAVRDALLCSTDVVQSVGTSFADARIFVSYRDTSTLPCIVLAYGNDSDISPTFGRTDRLRKLSVDCDCIATTVKASMSISEKVRKALHGASGTSRSTKVIEIRVLRESSNYDVGAEGDEGGIHITTVTVEATYQADAVSPITITTPGQAP